ncbi:unnamed protein product [Moneuplotes crassus]|uniref:CHORD domain-containing protein n=1 Tax=Euplotes crassus TaxID=5936 RepID=A0AAD2D641_EUPCR|nr:unnamed protein product [Moneuplotes crassus]
MEVEKKCRRPGCTKKYKDSENTPTSCKFHNGKPIFHDVKKGWECCNVVVYDWDEFQKIDGCCIGKHSDEKVESDFWKSSTVSTAQTALDKEGKRLRTAADYNKEQEEIKKKEEEDRPEMEAVIKDGKYACANKGCKQKYFLEEDNSDTSCEYHSGEPIFHDLMKGWSCCKTETYDWDDFVKLPTCSVGKHVIRYKTSKK